MNKPIRSFINPNTGLKEHSKLLHYGMNITGEMPNRRMRRNHLQKQARNPMYGLDPHTVQKIKVISEEEVDGEKLRLVTGYKYIVHSVLNRKLKATV